MTVDGGRPPRARWKKAGWVTAAVVLALGLSGLIVQPYAVDWWVARSACGGALPDGVLDVMDEEGSSTDGDPVQGHEEVSSRAEGFYRCTVEDGENERGYRFKAEAYTASAGVERQLRRDFPTSRYASQLALPRGLPGFEGRGATFVLVRSCPDLGKDATGRPRQLYARAYVPGYPGDVDSRDEKGAGKAYEAGIRAAVAVANEASRKLNCGAEQLPVPAKVARPASSSLKETAGTPCSAFAAAPLPSSSGRTVDMRISKRAPTGSCVLGWKDWQRYKSGEWSLDLTAFYGDWSEGLWKGSDRSEPWVRETEGWATARCNGTAAAFRVRASEVDDELPLEPKELRKLLADFAEQQAELRDCTDLRVPERTTPARAD
jgi:hypothetical protein